MFENRINVQKLHVDVVRLPSDVLTVQINFPELYSNEV